MGNWSINPHELASIDDNGNVTFQKHTEDVEYTITYNDNITGTLTKKFMVHGCGVDCNNKYKFSPITWKVEPRGAEPIAHSYNTEGLNTNIIDNGGFLDRIESYNIFEDDSQWEYRGYFNDTTSTSERTAVIKYSNSDGSCEFTQNLVMNAVLDCNDKYGWTGYTLQQGVRDNVGGAVGISMASAGTLVLRSKPYWVTFITANTSGDRIIYICKAEDNNGESRSGDVVFRSPDGKCEFSGTVEQAGKPAPQTSVRTNLIISDGSSGSLLVTGSTYTAQFIIAGPNAGTGELSGTLTADIRDDMTFGGRWDGSPGGTILNSCTSYAPQGLYAVGDAHWDLSTNTLYVTLSQCKP